MMTAIMKNQLPQDISCVIERQSEWVIHGTLVAGTRTKEIAEFFVGKRFPVWTTLFEDIAPTDVAPQGLRALQKRKSVKCLRPHGGGVDLPIMHGLKMNPL